MTAVPRASESQLWKMSRDYVERRHLQKSKQPKSEGACVIDHVKGGEIREVKIENGLINRTLKNRSRSPEKLQKKVIT